ncbi:hypothetical protein ATZ36_10630 [Candidatus Endomicrobiellum trichonymphae]|uniref:Uncharacterized protein n=1 Tax=Endomicrobium trichonymphae TaxID=1408204 RepID=A0A1E5IFS7_ENDTX|nr:hypothetical protein ATZ36_10630 [Candidatus Endomicrobium trichonymphae]
MPLWIGTAGVYVCDVWTVFQGDNSESIEKQLAKKKPHARVILYRQEQSKSNLKFIFELYCYIKMQAQSMLVVSFICGLCCDYFYKQVF